jgi:hypothetical protein
MTDTKDDWMGFEDAVQWIMKRTGRTRAQAIAALKEKGRKGEIAFVGDNIETGRREIIPPTAPAFKAEH